MAEILVQPATTKAKIWDGWLYVGTLFALAFAILLGLVALKFFNEHKLAPKAAGIEGAISQPRLDLLLIGSSHTRKSYDMRELERATGTSSIFLISYDGLDLTGMAQVLDYMAARPDTCPRHVVVEAYSVLLGRKPDLQDPRYYSEAPPSLKMTIIRTYLSSHRYLSAYLDVFDLLVNRGNEEILAHPFYVWADNVDSYKGGRALFQFPGMTPDQFHQLKANYYTAVPDPAQVAALNRILDLAKSHGIDLLFVDTPMPQPVVASPAIQALKKDFKDLVVSRGFKYIDGDQGFPIDDPSLFSDSNHLSSKGREAFTASIAIQLKAWLATGSNETP